MLHQIFSIPNRLKNFTIRNKYKLIGAGVVAGGVYYYYKDTIWQAIELYRLVQSVQQEEGGGVEELKDDEMTENPSYIQTVTTGDETAMKQYTIIRTHVFDLYHDEMQKIQSELKSRIEDREKLFQKLHSLTYSRLLTSIVASHILLLLARVEVCLIGRSNRVARETENDETRQYHREILSGLRILSSKETICRIDKICRRSFRSFDSMSPVSILKVSKMESAIDSIVAEMIPALSQSATLSTSSSPRSISAWSWLLGKLTSSPSGSSNGDEMSSIVCETLDVIESPQFTAVLEFIVKNSAHLAIRRSIPSGTREDASIAAAVLMPGIRIEPETVLTDGAVYYESVKEMKILNEFCYSVYMSSAQQEGEEDILHALRNSSSSSSSSIPDEAQIEKLGQLLEQLVRADINKH